MFLKFPFPSIKSLYASTTLLQCAFINKLNPSFHFVTCHRQKLTCRQHQSNAHVSISYLRRCQQCNIQWIVVRCALYFTPRWCFSSRALQQPRQVNVDVESSTDARKFLSPDSWLLELWELIYILWRYLIVPVWQ